MQVCDNPNGGKLYMVSNTAAVEFKQGIDPLGINFLVQLDHPVAPGCGRWSSQWYARHMTRQLDVDEDPTDAVFVVAWNVDSILANADENECPDFFDTKASVGRLSMVCRILQALYQGRTVAIQGTSAGLPT